MSEKKLKHIAIGMTNYEKLSSLHGFHDTFDDVISRLLDAAARNETNNNNSSSNRTTTNNKEKRTPRGAKVGYSAPSGRDSSSSNTAQIQEDLEIQEDLARVR